MTNHTNLIERQFERLREVETALANGAHFADEAQCHPLYPHAVAARQILETHIEELRAMVFASHDAIADALDDMRDGGLCVCEQAKDGLISAWAGMHDFVTECQVATLSKGE